METLLFTKKTIKTKTGSWFSAFQCFIMNKRFNIEKGVSSFFCFLFGVWGNNHYFDISGANPSEYAECFWEKQWESKSFRLKIIITFFGFNSSRHPHQCTWGFNFSLSWKKSESIHGALVFWNPGFRRFEGNGYSKCCLNVVRALQVLGLVN